MRSRHKGSIPTKTGIPYKSVETSVKTDDVDPLTMTVDHPSSDRTTICRRLCVFTRVLSQFVGLYS